MKALQKSGDAWLSQSGQVVTLCENFQYGACNWLCHSPQARYCAACQYNRTIPNLQSPENLQAFKKLAQGARRLFYAVHRWGLPAPTKIENPSEGIAFDFLEDQIDESGNLRKVMTGHDAGLITLAASEASDLERLKRQEALNEKYRTVLGHFRHEIGHYYWDRLIGVDRRRLDAFRVIFGDERVDYAESLKRNYTDGPPQNWADLYVSSYASSHPWEDFAESWAHYLHMVDTLETASALGVVSVGTEENTHPYFDPYLEKQFDKVWSAWPVLAVKLNEINRAMGMPDIYPFVVNEVIKSKIEFVHNLIKEPNRDGPSNP
ncbi:putative zinc-binding metallopeptidase [Methylocystis sp. 9N]|uniref:Zinc-binding metallopeptidase n=2 Tax=Methylocystis borbori TaxID=3118750 RepID=A0ABU7XHB2_9HYPH